MDKVTITRAERCTTHHFGCDCWQYKYQNMEMSLASFRRKCDELKAENEKMKSELDTLRDENKTLQFNLKQKAGEIGRAEHRGNTVDYIYDKCANYKRQFDEMRSEIERLKAELDTLRKHRNYASEFLDATDKLKIAREALRVIERFPFPEIEVKKTATKAIERIK